MPEAKVRLRRYLLKAKQANWIPTELVLISFWSYEILQIIVNQESVWVHFEPVAANKPNFILPFVKHCAFIDSLENYTLHNVTLLSGWMNLVYGL